MQQLHLVGFTTDLEGLIFSARRGAKSGGFVLALDDQLLELLEEALRLRGERDSEGEDPEGEERADPRSPGHPSKGAVITPKRAPRPESGLTPREIQSRLRAGRTIDEVASEAGVDQEWIARFAPPIQAEQRQVVDRARQLTFSKSRLGPSTQTLGTSVLWNLVDRGVALTENEYENGWTAYHLRDTAWVVRFAYVSRRRTQTAEWEVDLRDGELFSLNRLASDLGYVEPGRRKRRITFAEPPPEAPAPVAPAPARKAPAKKVTAKKVTAKKVTAKKVTAKKVTAKKAPAKRAAVKKAPTKKASTKKATAKKAAAKRAVVRKAPARKAAAKRPVVKTAAAKKKTKAPATKAPATRTPARKAAAARRTPATKKKAARPARGSGRKAAPRKAARRAPDVQPLTRATATPPVVARAALAAPEPVTPRRPPIVPVAASPAPPPGGRRPQPAVAEPVRRAPPQPAADLVTAGDAEQAPARAHAAVRVIPRPPRDDDQPTEIVRIDTRSPAVIASADRHSPEPAAERPRTRVRPLRAHQAPEPDARDVDPSPLPRPLQPAVRIRADQADRASPTPTGAVRAARDGRPRRRPLRAR